MDGVAPHGTFLHPPTPDAPRRVPFLMAERKSLQPNLRGCDGASTRCSRSGWRGAGRTDEPWGLQASLRGCNAERRRSSGLLRDRTHSESNGTSGLLGDRTPL